jgi:hypothetical protein
MFMTPPEIFPLTIAPYQVELTVVAVALTQRDAISAVFMVVPAVIITMVSVVVAPAVVAILSLEGQR